MLFDPEIRFCIDTINILFTTIFVLFSQTLVEFALLGILGTLSLFLY